MDSIMTLTTQLTASLSVCFALALVGCGDSPVSDSDSVSSPFLVSSEPAGAITPTEFKEAASSEHETVDDAAVDDSATVTTNEVVLAGKIDAGDLDPFEPGKATFVLSELPDAEHAAGDPDHANNCPFCKRRLKNAPKVVVRFVDDSGELIAQDAQAMLGVKKGDSVVVKGVAEYQEAINMIQINAESIYRR
ncbi:signal peptide protein [Rhodopirellula maiorica SM1]|uniref:Signal peptide protein n=2 Tax=Novipirellula TaxID=2795426 RepID=M5RJ33_9BACT|nr:signal peptide protein [Rhodopirellula maiorica SM1]